MVDVYETFKLNSDSILIPLEEAPAHIRNTIRVADAEFIISRSSSRRGALALNKCGAAFARLFTNGESLPGALRKLSLEFNIPVGDLAHAIYPLIERLVQEEHLIRERDIASAAHTSSQTVFQKGDVFNGYTILSHVQQLDDTAVYKAQDRRGDSVALKILRKRASPIHDSFKREALILRHLQGDVSPRLIDADTEGDSVFIAIEWIDGYSLIDWCSRVRNLPHQQRYADLLALSRSLLLAYQTLHRKGVLHGDIWPRNVYFDRHGSIRLLDFGTSWFEPANTLYGEPNRTNNAYFRTPDLAAAELEGARPPAASAGSEIYALGAMLYIMITGRNYLDFSFVQDEQLRQVCTAPMLPLATHGIEWSEMESLLSLMLHKDPSLRAASLEDCLSRLDNISPPEAPPARSTAPSTDAIPFLRSYASDRLLAPPEPPSASIFFGAGGIAYAMLIAAISLQDQHLLPEADYLTVCSKRWMLAGPEGSCNPDADIPNELLGAHSIFHRIEGIALIEALTAHTLGDRVSLRRVCLHFIKGIHKAQASAEFAFGKAGLLNAILQLTFLTNDNKELIRVGDELAGDILSEIESYGSMAQSPIRFTGFAHGWSGILYSLLSWGRSHNGSLINRVIPFLHQLQREQVRCSRGSYWRAHFDEPVETGDTASWCTGSGGFILLWTEAFQATGENHWIQLGRDAGMHAATHQDKAFDLCCGLAGRAFCLGTLYRITQEQEWLTLAKTCLANATPHSSARLHSLFKGFPGVELARAELMRPQHISFPTLAVDRFGERLAIGQLEDEPQGSAGSFALGRSASAV